MSTILEAVFESTLNPVTCWAACNIKSHLFVERYYKECGMSDLHLDCYPRNIILFLECIDKMVDAYADSDAWTQEQKDVLDKYINCLYSHGYIDFSLMIFETLRQIDTNPAAKVFISNIKLCD